MRLLRRASQLLFLLVFLWLFLKASYPYNETIPSDLLLRISPLTAVILMITSLRFVQKLLPALIILGLTIPLGRFFCGWICPLGTIIDIGDHLIKGGNKGKNSQWKHVLLIFLLVSSLISVQLVWFFDPIALLNRVLTTSFYPLLVYVIDKIPGIYLWFLPLRQPYFPQGIVILLTFVGILALGIFGRRFWCRNLCPLGALLGVFSRFRLLQRKVNDRCRECGICSQICKMGAIKGDFKAYSEGECVECMNCLSLCPNKAITYGFSFKLSPPKFDLSRRRVILSIVTGVVVAGIIRRKSSRGDAVRPPGAVEEEKFLDLCIRCQECVKGCSTTGGFLQPAFLETGLEGIWTPVGNPDFGYCEYTCNLCAQLCPTGAIHPLSLTQKQRTKIGTAQFNRNRCLPWHQQEDCLVCEEHCPVPGKAIRFTLRQITKPNGSKGSLKLPYVVEELCIGCGICVNKCPLEGEAGIFITNAGEQRIRI